MKDYLDEYIVATRLIHRKKGATIDELAEALNKTPRAVFDILSQLDMMLFPIYDEQDPENPHKKRYHAEGRLAEYLPDYEFTDEDKEAFNYLIDNASNAPGMEAKIRHLLTKVRLMASEHGVLLENGNRKDKTIISMPEISTKIDFKQIQGVSEDISSAIKSRSLIDIHFIPIGRQEPLPDWKQLFPVEMIIAKGDLYLFAYNSLGRLWAIPFSRITSVTKIYHGPVPEMKVTIKELLQDPFGFDVDSQVFTVKLWIDEKLAPIVQEKKWPKSVTFESSEGGVIMTAQTRSLIDCEVWIFEHMPYVKVLEPCWFRAQLLETLKKTIALNESEIIK